MHTSLTSKRKQNKQTNKQNQQTNQITKIIRVIEFIYMCFVRLMENFELWKNNCMLFVILSLLPIYFVRVTENSN